MVKAMSGELVVDGRELLAMAEEAPEQVEVIIAMMIEAEEDLFPEDTEDEDSPATHRPTGP